MSLALVKELPLTGFAPSNKDIAKYLREQAGWLEDVDAAPMRTVVLVLEGEDGAIHRQTAGQPCDITRVVGLLTMASLRAALVEGA